MAGTERDGENLIMNSATNKTFRHWVSEQQNLCCMTRKAGGRRVRLGNVYECCRESTLLGLYGPIDDSTPIVQGKYV